MTISDNKSDKEHRTTEDIKLAVVALSAHDTVNLYGSANAEYVIGYRGVNNETGQKLAKGLKGISKGKINPEYKDQNIKQQAGYSAEVATTNRDNAEAIINRSSIRTSRSDDLPSYGKNHPIVDRVKILNGEIIEGSQSQMKFVGNRNELFSKIAKEDGKFARYRGIKLELPSEQYEGAAEHCRNKAKDLRSNANAAQQKGNLEAADKLRLEANNYDQLADNVSDSGLTTEKAIFYRKHPEIATALDIINTSHKAGMEGAKYGALIGCCISVLQNSFYAIQGNISIADFATDTLTDTAKATAVGYGTAFVGSAIKGVMQQSGQQAVRTLANTSAPTMVVNICLSLSSSIKHYVKGEISEAQLLTEVGEKGAGMLSSGMMAALGQVAIPLPFVGAAIGGMIGYTLSSFFYQSALEAAQGVATSSALLARTSAIQQAARRRLEEEQTAFDNFMRREIPQLQEATHQLFNSLQNNLHNPDTFASAINQYATLLGKNLEFQSIEEFDDFMNSGRPLTL